MKVHFDHFADPVDPVDALDVPERWRVRCCGTIVAESALTRHVDLVTCHRCTRSNIYASAALSAANRSSLPD